MKLESDKRVVCDGSCSESARCLRLYFCDAEDWGGMSAWRTWLDSRIALPNCSSSAMLHRSSNVGRSGGLYPWRRARFSTESMRLRSVALMRPRHALAAYVRRATRWQNVIAQSAIWRQSVSWMQKNLHARKNRRSVCRVWLMSRGSSSGHAEMTQGKSGVSREALWGAALQQEKLSVDYVRSQRQCCGLSENWQRFVINVLQEQINFVT